MKSILEKNIKKMTGESEGDMKKALSIESIGGNAGNWMNYPCIAANFSFDSLTGEIKYFGNIQCIPKEISSKSKRGVLRLAIDAKKSWKFYITKCETSRCARLAEKNLKKTIEKYNQKHGFKPIIQNNNL